jgi:MinD-like ATPase involved in chromosome partitioning or flagellar assembly
MARAKLVSFWSANGSPGKSSLAISVAAELVASSKRVLLIDADTFGPSIDVLLGLNDHPAGLAAACRLVFQQRFDVDQLERLSVNLEVGKNQLSVMTGLSSASRWAEVSEEKFSGLIYVAQSCYDFVILDLASSIESDVAQVATLLQRNCVSRWALKNSDQVVAVCGADPLAIARHLDAISALMDIQERAEVITVVNRLRVSVLGSSAKSQILETLFRLGQIQVAGFIPDDPAAADAAIRSSVPLALGKRSSAARQAIALITKTQILGQKNQLDRSLSNRAVAKLV